MGNSFASNTVNDAVDVFFNLMIGISQKCGTRITEQQALNFQGCHDINYSNIDWNQTINIGVKCVQDSKTNTDIDTQIKEAIKQVSSAINQAVDFNPGSTNANNVVNLVTKLATTIQEQFSQNCSANLEANQVINCVDSSGITLNGVYFNQTMDVMRSCVMNTDAVTKAKTDLVQQISQSATARVKSILGALLGMLLIILVIGAAILFLVTQGGISILTNPLALASIALIILALLLVFYFLQWWPYAKVSSNDSAATQAKDEHWNRMLVFIVLGLLVGDLALIFLLYRAGQRIPFRWRQQAAPPTPTPAPTQPAPQTASATA